MMAGVCTGPGPCDTHPTGHGGDNFVTRGGGFDPYLRAIINALKRSGHSESQAVQLAVGIVQRWARGQGNVTAETRARAAKALARWEALKASAHLSNITRSAVDLATPMGDPMPVTRSAMAPLPGSVKPRFPINNHNDLKRAIKAVGRAKGDHAKVRRHIITRAKAVGGAHLLPDNWTSTGNLK